jgi:hypothetical protein
VSSVCFVGYVRLAGQVTWLAVVSAPTEEECWRMLIEWSAGNCDKKVVRCESQNPNNLL